jgi:O-antigen/teichoic acid export membrane protein
MSTAARLISGSAASWAQIAVTMISQIALVPIFLSYWNVKTFGIWLAIQGVMSVLSMLDLGHQNYVGYEFLKLGRNNLLAISKSLWSAVIISLSISIFQLLLIAGFFFTGTLSVLLGESATDDSGLIHSAGVALIFLGFSWLINTSISGLMNRALAVFGYYPRMAWWGVVFAVANALIPLIAVVLGAGLIKTSMFLAAGIFACSVPLYLDFFALLRKEKVKIIKPSLALGYANFGKSLPILGKTLFENFRQQGVRLLLAPLAGPIGLAAFSTMRTGANVALQGLNTVINPLLPDLMRFLNNKDQARSEAGFATLWIVVIALMAPGVVILQTFVEPLFLFWTKGKIVFDPLLFALLSLGVLVYAVVQPAMAIVIGNNLTKTQLMLTIVAAVVVLLFLCVLVPLMGIVGAGIALLLAEISSAIGYKIYAVRWLKEHRLRWPARSFHHAVFSVVIAAAALTALLFMPQFKWTIVTVSMVIFGWNFWLYWQLLPSVATSSAKQILNKVPGVRRLLRTGVIKTFFC